MIRQGGAGSIQGNFYDIQERFIATPLMTGVWLRRWRYCGGAERLICVCSGLYKDKALLGLLRTGLVHTLITNSQLAQNVKKLCADGQ